ncbi:TetR/AcrR family transcriptional regulator [Geodermatophilus chilensis]|uniref:TetR/AcrR family transcriptional regulator n=1 Tax=Geodermatophilus chilensis TaxID=2035835 RepID=UPI0018E3FE36|nr:TetR/AcrR family transcriptional regulator [Geodermatophilus chilensis]
MVDDPAPSAGIPGSGDRRAAILARSAELFATRGVTATTVRDIGEAAGVLSGSLYHHFRSKDAIVGEVLAEFMADVQHRFAEVARRSRTPEETVRGLVHATLTVIEEHPHPTAMYQNDRQYLRERGLLEPVRSASRAVRDHWLKALEAGSPTAPSAGTYHPRSPTAPCATRSGRRRTGRIGRSSPPPSSPTC